MSWTKTHYMTVGFLAIFIGFNLRAVETFVLSDETVNIVNPDEIGYGAPGGNPNINQQAAYNRNSLFRPTYQSAGYQSPQQVAAPTNQTPLLSGKNFTPPSWLGWPLICVGSVMLLFGLSIAPGSKSVPDYE